MTHSHISALFSCLGRTCSNVIGKATSPRGCTHRGVCGIYPPALPSLAPSVLCSRVHSAHAADAPHILRSKISRWATTVRVRVPTAVVVNKPLTIKSKGLLLCPDFAQNGAILAHFLQRAVVACARCRPACRGSCRGHSSRHQATAGNQACTMSRTVSRNAGGIRAKEKPAIGAATPAGSL